MPTEPKSTPRMMCMQLSTSVHRWADELLVRAFPKHVFELDAVREELKQMEAEGIDVFDCHRHRCDEHGRCTGEPLEARDE